MIKVNKNVRRRIWVLFLFLLVFYLWGKAIYHGQYIGEQYSSVSVRMKTGSVSKHILMKTVERELKKGNGELKSVSAWKRSVNKSVSCEELNTEVRLQLIETIGDMEKVYPIKLVSGSIPSAVDTLGCLIDEETAYSLFHTTEAAGAMLVYDERRYCVRGVLRSAEPVCLLEVEEGENTFSNLEFVFSDKDNGTQLAADFLRLLDADDQYIIIDGSLSAGVLKMAYLLPAWLLVFCMMYDLLLVLWRRRTIPLQALPITLTMLLLGWVLIWFLDVRIGIPQQFIPTKWSDFAFWSKKITELRDWIHSFSYITPNDKDLLFRQYAEYCLLYGIAATIGMLALIPRARNLLHGNNKAVGFILIAISECAIIGVLLASGSLLTLPRAYLSMPILYMIVRDVIEHLNPGAAF